MIHRFGPADTNDCSTIVTRCNGRTEHILQLPLDRPASVAESKSKSKSK